MKRTLVVALFAVVTFLSLLNHSEADVILAPGSIWEYTFADPTGDQSWNTTTGGWATGAAPFGCTFGGGNTDDPTGVFDYNIYWPSGAANGLNDDLWVRKTINLTGFDLTTILWNLGVDNGFKLYINGNYVFGDNAEGYTYRWEYSGAIPSNLLVPTENIVAVALEDHGGSTAFDMQITGTKAVAEPATILLLGAGMAGLVFVRRRFNR